MSMYFIFDGKEDLKSVYEDEDSIRKAITERNKGLTKSAVAALDLCVDSTIVLDYLGFDSALHELLYDRDKDDIEWLWSKGYGDIDKRSWTSADDQIVIDKINKFGFRDFIVASHDVMRITDPNDDKIITVKCTNPNFNGVEIYIDKDISKDFGTYRLNISYVTKAGKNIKVDLNDADLWYGYKAWVYSPYNRQIAESLEITYNIADSISYNEDGGIDAELRVEHELSVTCKECDNHFKFKPEDFYYLDDTDIEGIYCPGCGIGIEIIGYDESTFYDDSYG